MNRSKLHLLWNMAALLLCASAASCSQDEIDIEQGEPLPPDKYPLELMTSSIDETQSRAAGKDEWTYDGTEYIGVRIGADGNIGKYVIGAGGSAQPASIDQTIYWQSTAPATVTAWYPFETQTAKDITDQSGGYEAIDYLKATAENKRFTDKVDLSFIHQMAKVSCTLKKGDGITDEDLEGATVQIAGYTKASFSEGILTGTDDGWITPTATDCEALLVPQDMTNSQFIKVSINDNNFIYTPGEGAANLQSGTHYIYTITVKKDGIEVSSVSASWNDEINEGTAGEATFRVYLPEGHGQTISYSSNVTEQDGYLEVKGNPFTISYNVTDENRMKGFPITDGIGKMERTMSGNGYTFTYTLRSDVRLTYGDYAEAGDYYYSDGTWRPDYVADNGCIGIVFKSGAGESDDISAYGGKLTAIRGYVVALADAHDEAGAWGIRQRTESNLPSESSYTPKYNGYANTAAIRNVTEYATTDISKPTENGQYWAFRVASDYSVIAPSGSSGWYLPSIGQLADIYNLPDRAGLFAGAGGTDFKSEINDGRYWSSTQKNGYDAWYYRFNGSGAEAYAKSNDGGNFLRPSYVRAVLTF